MMSVFRAITLVGAFSGLFLADLALADTEPDAAIKYRKGVMGAIGANMGNVGAIAKGEVPFKANLAAHLNGIALAAGMAPTAFEQNTDGQGSEKTTAKAKVWEDWAKFEARLMKLGNEATQLAALAEQDPDAALADIGDFAKNCKACHDNFRDK